MCPKLLHSKKPKRSVAPASTLSSCAWLSGLSVSLLGPVRGVNLFVGTGCAPRFRPESRARACRKLLTAWSFRPQLRARAGKLLTALAGVYEVPAVGSIVCFNSDSEVVR